MRTVKRLLRGIKHAVIGALNLDMMGERYTVLVVNYLLFVLYTVLESTFVNTLLYTVLDDITIVIFYRAITYLSIAVMMHPAAYLGQKKTPIVVIRTSAYFYLTMYALLFFGLNHMDVLLVPIAIMSGSGCAFYWSGHTSLVPHYTTRNNRDIGIAVLGIVQGLMTLLVPLVSGYVIRLMPGTSGYRVMFGVGMAAVVGQAMMQRRLAPVEQKRHVSQARLAFRLLRRKLSFKLMFGYEFLRGFRDGAFAFILNMLLFEIVTDESLVGINTFLTGAASMLGSVLYARVVRPNMRGQITMAVAALLTLCSLPLYTLLNTATVMAFTLISAFFTLFMTNSCSNTTYDVMGQNETTRKCMGETAAIREGALGLGRLSGLVVLLAFRHGERGYVTAILVLTSAQLLCGLMMLLTQRTLNRKKKEEAAKVNPI